MPHFSTHGETRDLRRPPEYKAWDAMRYRCYATTCRHFDDYGGRGITVCDRWRNDFAAFLADMGRRPSPGHSLDRIDNDGPYCPENCRWATREEQNNNRRSTTFVTYGGRTLSVRDWSRLTLIPYPVLKNRLLRGWGPERAISQPYACCPQRRPLSCASSAG